MRARRCGRGVRIGVRLRGCCCCGCGCGGGGDRGGGCGGGYQYALGFDAQGEKDSTFESQGLKLIVNNDDVNKINGTEIDYVVSEMGEGFRVNNPNPAPEGKKGKCGCGNGGCC